MEVKLLDSAPLPLPLAGEGWGEGKQVAGFWSRPEERPHPALRADFSRRREK